MSSGMPELGSNGVTLTSNGTDIMLLFNTSFQYTFARRKLSDNLSDSEPIWYHVYPNLTAVHSQPQLDKVNSEIKLRLRKVNFNLIQNPSTQYEDLAHRNVRICPKYHRFFPNLGLFKISFQYILPRQTKCIKY